MSTKILEWLGMKRVVLEEWCPGPNIKKLIRTEEFHHQNESLLKHMVHLFLRRKYDYRCAYCWKEYVDFDIDHKIPLSQGGTTKIKNLVLSCRQCNERKGSLSYKIFGVPRYGKSTLSNHIIFPYNMIRIRLYDGKESIYGMRKNDYIRDGFSIIKLNDKKRLIYKSSKVQSKRNINSLVRHNIILFGRKI